MDVFYTDFDKRFLRDSQTMELDELRRKARLYEIITAASMREIVAIWEAANATGCSIDPMVEALGRRIL